LGAQKDRKIIHERLVRRLLSGEATTSPQDRVGAFNRAVVPEPLERLLAEVASGRAHVADDDITLAKTAGFTEDQIFELVICAAVGAATRQYEQGLAALARARSNGQGG
jgi:hypothetical protein